MFVEEIICNQLLSLWPTTTYRLGSTSACLTFAFLFNEKSFRPLRSVGYLDGMSDGFEVGP